MLCCAVVRQSQCFSLLLFAPPAFTFPPSFFCCNFIYYVSSNVTVDIAIFAILFLLWCLCSTYRSIFFHQKMEYLKLKSGRGHSWEKRCTKLCLSTFTAHFFPLVFWGHRFVHFHQNWCLRLMYANIVLFIYTSVCMSVVCLYSISDPKMCDFCSVFFRFNEMDIKYEYIQLYVYTWEIHCCKCIFKNIFLIIFFYY